MPLPRAQGGSNSWFLFFFFFRVPCLQAGGHGPTAGATDHGTGADGQMVM